jgi:uncharacterized protein
VIFSVVVKPTHLCNLSCTYCYNDDVRDPVMKPATVERLIGQTFSYARDHVPGRLVSFIWHGGEPTIPGVGFYERVAELQRSSAQGVLYNNSLQTNGTLLDDRWLTFLKDHDYTVSISIDGPADLHDRYRVDRRGRGSFARVLAAIHRVQDAGVPLGVCVVISRANIDRVDEIYDLLARERLRFNVIPLNRSGAARDNYADMGLAADEYADAWIRMYDRWFDADDHDYVYCSDFVFKTRAIIAGRPADCIGLEQCSDTNISVDPVGDVYACATLSGTAETCYGNIHDTDLETLMNGPTASGFRHRSTDPQCDRCRWQHVCHGGCQARAYKFFGDHNERDYYCPSLFRIYEHIARRVAARFDRPWQPLRPVPDLRTIAGTTSLGTAVPLTLRKGRDGEPVTFT